MTEQMLIDLGPVKATYYAHAPDTSREAAESEHLRRSKTAMLMLKEYARASAGLTPDEASYLVDVSLFHGRPTVTRMKKCGYLSVLFDAQGKAVRRLNDSGKYATVLQITDKGRGVLDD